MTTKELSKQVRDSVVEKYKLELGYKKNIQIFDDPQEHHQIYHNQWKEHGTKGNLPRDGRPPKLTDQAKRALIREAANRPKATLEEL